MKIDFDIKFKKVTEEIIKRAIEGMGQAGAQLLNDCVMLTPTVPIKEGWLRGSGSVFVDDKLVMVSKEGKAGLANTDSPGMKRNNAIVVVVGFNTPYAHRLHEGIDFKFSEPSAGPKYLESKMISRKDVYQRIVSDRIKQ